MTLNIGTVVVFKLLKLKKDRIAVLNLKKVPYLFWI